MTKQARGGLRLAGSLAALLMLGCAAAAPACAQISNNSNDPTQIDADKSELTRDDGHGVYLGNVDVTQGTARLKTDKLTIVCDLPPGPPPAKTQSQGRSCAAIKEMIADGNVYYVTPDGTIHGDRAVYDKLADTITVTGNPAILKRGDEGVSKSGTLIYDVQKGVAHLAGSGAGDRVSTIILQTDKKTDDKGGAKPATPATPAPAAPAAPKP